MHVHIPPARAADLPAGRNSPCTSFSLRHLLYSSAPAKYLLTKEHRGLCFTLRNKLFVFLSPSKSSIGACWSARQICSHSAAAGQDERGFHQAEAAQAVQRDRGGRTNKGELPSILTRWLVTRQHLHLALWSPGSSVDVSTLEQTKRTKPLFT